MAEKNTVCRQSLYFEGKVRDGEETLVKVLEQAKESIVIIDEKLTLRTLELLKAAAVKVPVIIYTENEDCPEMLTRAKLKTFFAKNASMRILIGTIAGKAKDRYIILDNGTPSEKVYVLSFSIAEGTDGCMIEKKDTDFVRGMLDVLQENSYLILR